MGEAILINHKRKIKDESLVYLDEYTNIGAKRTLEGASYDEAGYFGIVPSSQLFTGSELASAVGITAGRAQNDTTDWLKFYIDGKIIFKSMKTIRYNISWQSIDIAGCALGTKTVTKNGVTFAVRLMRGAVTNPSIATSLDKSTIGSEWNRLMYPIHTKATLGKWKYPQYVDEYVPNWGIEYTDGQLHTASGAGNGTYHWCMETTSTSINTRLARGYDGVEQAYEFGYSSTGDNRGWSPVLEVIPN